MKRSLFIKSATMLAIMGCYFSSVPMMNEKTGIVTTALAAGPSSYLTEEQVIPLMKKILIDTTGYAVEDIYLDETIALGQNGAVWTSYWVKEKGGNERIYIDVDATTGKLVQFTRFMDDNPKETAVGIISEKEALKKAEAFINAVAPEVQGHISKANEYQVDDSLPPQVMNHVFHFVRVENEIPFLENYLQVIVDSQGEIGSYSRKWYDGELPSPVPAISAEEAGRRWDESLKPALHYVYTGEQIGKYGLPQKKMILAYAYDEKAPVFIDAMTNQPMTFLGESISQQSPMIPIGTSTRTMGKEHKKLTDYEKSEKADEIARTMFQAERDHQTSGSIAAVSWDGFGEGSSSRATAFHYVRPAQGKEKAMRFHLGMDDYGEVTSFSVEEEHSETENRIYPNPIPYEKAQAIAADFIKKFYPDRQGELYAIHLPPTEESKKWLFQRNGGYYITFGWLKQGIPVQNLETGVTVDPVNGEVKGMYTFPAYQSLEMIQGQKAGIDEQKAKQVEKGNKKLRLTYFMPYPEWRNGTYLVSREPKLVYRMVGDDGVVDADSGKWVSYTAYKQSKIPEDIAAHPHYLELLYAVKDGYFPVINSQLDPDQPVTRGEFLRILLKAQQSYDFFPDEYEVAGEKQFFTDIDKAHPLYETVQDAIERGLIQATTSNKQFGPDRNLTNVEANEMISRLLKGSGDKKGALSVFSTGQPTKIMTKADVARLLMELKSYADSTKQE
ncbi:S-layer family protein [Brevibacillus sp. AG162]|nr:S-layer family protein [Brevibacillus sp. AG162]